MAALRDIRNTIPNRFSDVDAVSVNLFGQIAFEKLEKQQPTPAPKTPFTVFLIPERFRSRPPEFDS